MFGWETLDQVRKINNQLISFLKNYNLLDDNFKQLIVFKLGFFSLVAVEWFVFTHSIMASSLNQIYLFSNDV